MCPSVSLTCEALSLTIRYPCLVNGLLAFFALPGSRVSPRRIHQCRALLGLKLLTMFQQRAHTAIEQKRMDEPWVALQDTFSGLQIKINEGTSQARKPPTAASNVASASDQSFWCFCYCSRYSETTVSKYGYRLHQSGGQCHTG